MTPALPLRVAYRKALLLLAGSLLLFSCGSKPTGLTISVEENLLGPYNASPTFTWSVGSPGSIEQAWYRLSDTAEWEAVLPDTGSFMPEERLAPGDYTLQFMVKSGVYTETASLSFSVSGITPFTPDDEYYATAQWNMTMLNMPELWGLLTALIDSGQIATWNEVVVAVIDTGYTEHPDLKAHLDMENDYDFITEHDYDDDGEYDYGDILPNDGDDWDGDATDAGDDEGDDYGNSWHGTSVGGTIAAETDNDGEGVAGVNLPAPYDNITILPLRALGAGGGTTYNIGQAVRYAAGLLWDGGPALTEPRAKIINMSLGGPGATDTYMNEALQAAVEAGCIPVAASGNESTGFIWASVGSPANSPYTIAVASVDSDGGISAFSNMGAEIDIAAPGGTGGTPVYGLVLPSADPYATSPPTSGDYTYTHPDEPQWYDPNYHQYGIKGTSFSCPHVAGILALLCGVDPDLTFDEAREILHASGKDVTPPVSNLYDIPGMLNGVLVFEAYLGGRIYADISRGITDVRILDTAPGGEEPGKGRILQVPEEDLIDRSSLIVTFKATKSLGTNSELAAGMGAKSVKGETGWTRLLIRKDTESFEDFKARLEADPSVEAVYFNYRYYPN